MMMLKYQNRKNVVLQTGETLPTLGPMYMLASIYRTCHIAAPLFL